MKPGRPTSSTTPRPVPSTRSSSRARWTSCTRTARRHAASITTPWPRMTARAFRWKACTLGRDLLTGDRVRVRGTRSAQATPAARQHGRRRASRSCRRPTVQHVRRAEDPRPPRQLLQRPPAALHRRAGPRQLCRPRRLVPRELVPANLPRHRRRSAGTRCPSPPPAATLRSCSPRPGRPPPPPASTSRPTSARSTPSPSTPTARSPAWSHDRRQPLQCVDQWQYRRRPPRP